MKLNNDLLDTIEKQQAHIDHLEKILDGCSVKLGNKTYKLNKWYPLVDEGDYWIEYCGLPNHYKTIITDGELFYTKDNCPYGWSTMANKSYTKWYFSFVSIKIND